jgi:hypothetical protein
LLLERDRLGLAGVFSAAASLMESDFDVEPALTLRPGFVSGFGSASLETDAADAVAGPTFVFALTL